ncbi:MAG TPA: Na+/H+ antiporter NhaA [Polyangiaceae bacterium]|nr:Na+/H+ antiporter NhaA [Polyangiaceae bacterium]
MKQPDASPIEPAPRVPADHPPGVWVAARRFVLRASAPVERFLAIEASSGILLLGAAVVALLWANSPWAGAYQRLWHTPFGVRLGPWSFERDLQFWINDALMTVFFFVAGLEIRREIHQGELSEWRRAALPLVAAVGGMIAPALIYTAFNHGHPSSVGWGIPMATDIAFAVGALVLLGKRVPPGLRILLLALAVIDDVGAILVIALFYSADVQLMGFSIVALGVVGIWAMRLLGVRSPWAYVPPSAVLWAGTYRAGIHPTLAGVAVGLLTPVRAWLGAEHFVLRTLARLERYRIRALFDVRSLLPELDALHSARREAVSPVDGLQYALHGWVAYGIMPLFALANAGVPLGQAELDAGGLRVFLGVSVGLVVGKPLGILALSALTKRLGLTAFPTGAGLREVSLVGIVAGIGFTMALFVAQLAFPSGPLLETAKLAIICGSALAALLSVVVGRFLLGPHPSASSDAEPEASTSA